jgi:hypothetical protein
MLDKKQHRMILCLAACSGVFKRYDRLSSMYLGFVQLDANDTDEESCFQMVDMQKDKANQWP